MKLIIKSLRIYMSGVYLRMYKYFFDKKIDKKIRRGKSISGKHLTRMSKKYQKLTDKFNNLEKSFLASMKKYS